MDDKQIRVVAQEKWLAGGIWLSLLVTLIGTSYSSCVAPVGAYFFSAFSNYQAINLFANEDKPAAMIWMIALLVVSLLSTIFLVIQLILAWKMFSGLTHNLMVSLAQMKDPKLITSIDFNRLKLREGKLQAGESGQRKEDLSDIRLSRLLGKLGIIWVFIRVIIPVTITLVEGVQFI